jgi:CarD family transcriptional regulator
MSFEVGETVVYPHHGAALIERREERDLFGEHREYLVLHVAHNQLTMLVPVDNTEAVGLRPLINFDEVDDVFGVLGRRDTHVPSNWARRFKNHMAKLQSGNIYEVAEVVRNLSVRSRQKALAAAETEMLTTARRILLSELTVVLGVGEEQAQEQLDAALV